MMTGIDYGRGLTNVDTTTGIRYGVINSHHVCQSWGDESEPDYGTPTCPHCGNIVADDTKHDTDTWTQSTGCDDYYCESCKRILDVANTLPDKPHAWYVDTPTLQASQSHDDCDIFVCLSEYYTYAAYCSPCAPGACYLTNPTSDGDKAYCFGPDWFVDEPCPYPIYRVSDDTLVYSPPTDDKGK